MRCLIRCGAIEFTPSWILGPPSKTMCDSGRNSPAGCISRTSIAVTGSGEQRLCRRRSPRRQHFPYCFRSVTKRSSTLSLPGKLEVLVQRLSRWCRPGTKLFMLISDLPNIPVSPTVFRILNREEMIHEIPIQETRPCPRHQPRDIARLMARFNISCSFLMRHGIQEYVFAFK